MKDKLKPIFIWWTVYILIEFLLIYVFKFRVNETFLYVGMVGGLYILINLFLSQYKRERLFINGIVAFISVALIGILIGNHLNLLQIICLAICISVVDVLSFTRYGKKTANAKIMSNPNYLYRLMVYGKGKGDNLYPTCGLGDYFHFSLWISGLSKNIHNMILLCIALLIGNLINMLIVHKVYTNSNYKGVPATTIPCICILICYIFL